MAAEDAVFWKLQCGECKVRASAVITFFGFDRHGSLFLRGVCRLCFKTVRLEHDANEVQADINEAHNKWADQYGQDKLDALEDMKLWEEELKDDG